MKQFVIPSLFETTKFFVLDYRLQVQSCVVLLHSVVYAHI